MDYASSVYSFNLHSLLPVCFSPLYLLSISWCPLSLRFTLSHPVSVNLIYLLLTLTLSVFFLRWLGPSCPPSAPHFLRLFTLKTALWATHSFGSLSTHGGCIDSPISAEMLAGLDTAGWKHLARGIPLISPLLHARSSRGTFQSFRQSFTFLLHPFFLSPPTTSTTPNLPKASP